MIFVSVQSNNIIQVQGSHKTDICLYHGYSKIGFLIMNTFVNDLFTYMNIIPWYS